MANKTKWTKTLVIVGPTASGKTGVAIELARRLGGEIISADSRAIYKGLDLGTAKPTRREQRGVPHFGLDLVKPDERFTVADFKAYAEQKIAEIQARGHLPIVVGGTGLYVDALIYDYQFDEQAKHHQTDRRKPAHNFYTIGIQIDRPVLRQRIHQRALAMFGGKRAGKATSKIVRETKRLARRYDFRLQAMRSNIYPIVWRMLQGELTPEQAIAEFELDDWHLAKRQLTWFKRNPSIVWLERQDIVQHVHQIKNLLRLP